MEHVLTVYRLINGLFLSYFSLLLLWVFSIFCLYTSDELEKKLKVNRGTRDADKPESSATDSIANVEKFVELFQAWLYEEERLTTGSESLDEKIFKLKIACKELKRVQIVVDTLKMRATSFHSPMSDCRRILDLLDKFEHTKAYMELRQYMLTVVQRQFSVFVEQGKSLKIWLSEALEFQEILHNTTCDSRTVIQEHLLLTQTIRKQSEGFQGKLDIYERSAHRVTATLQEISAWSDIFQQALSEKTRKNGSMRWNEILTDSVIDEITQVGQRFSTVKKLQECYRTHLEGLQQRTLQEHKAPKS